MGDINLEIKIRNLEAKTAGEINDTINNIYGTSDQWSSKSSWQVGEICIYDNKLWKCLVSNSNKPSKGNEWTQISLKSVVEVEEIPLSDILTLNSDISINAAKVLKCGNIVHIMIDAFANLAAGSNTIGNCKSKLMGITMLSGRVTSGSDVYPTTAILIPNGTIRIHTNTTGSAFVIAGTFFVN